MEVNRSLSPITGEANDIDLGRSISPAIDTMNIKDSGSNSNRTTPKNDKYNARLQEMGNFLNKRMATTAPEVS